MDTLDFCEQLELIAVELIRAAYIVKWHPAEEGDLSLQGIVAKMEATKELIDQFRKERNK